MWKDPEKHFLVQGKQLNMIIATLQMVSDKFPDIGSFNRFIQNLKDMRAYNDMLDEFIFGDQKTYPRDKKRIGEKDSMTLDEMMKSLELRFMDERDRDNGKN